MCAAALVFDSFHRLHACLCVLRVCVCFFCLPVCLSVHLLLPACLSVCLSICCCLSACLSGCTSVSRSLSAFLSLCTSVSLSVCVPVCLFFCLCVCACFSVSVCLCLCSISLSAFLSLCVRVFLCLVTVAANIFGKSMYHFRGWHLQVCILLRLSVPHRRRSRLYTSHSRKAWRVLRNREADTSKNELVDKAFPWAGESDPRTSWSNLARYVRQG